MLKSQFNQVRMFHLVKLRLDEELFKKKLFELIFNYSSTVSKPIILNSFDSINKYKILCNSCIENILEETNKSQRKKNNGRKKR